ncbi:hypothetical protein BASA81_017074 [Batrachochytrium salamandrivorans]|nr:hypothetical protein BASA81_017074 [Batrachochytrium salamandrivorans]
MKLAIASTPLVAMMAAQAAVLSTTSSTDVNLVKRAPTSDDEADVEQSDMAGQSSSDPISQLPLSKHEKEKSTCYMLAKLEFQFREMMTKREPQANVYRELKKAVYEATLVILDNISSITQEKGCKCLMDKLITC